MKKIINKKEIKTDLLDHRFAMQAFLALVFSWVCFVLFNYYKNNPVNPAILEYYFSLNAYSNRFGINNISSILEHLATIMFAVIIFFASYSIGKIPLKLVGLSGISLLEEKLLSLAFGIGLLIYFVFLAGVFGLLYKTVILVIIISACLYGLLDFNAKQSIEVLKSVRKALFSNGLLNIILIPLIAAIILIGCLSPEIFYDSLVYHISKPNFWLQSHKIMPDLSYSFAGFMPGNVSIFYAVGLMFSDETICKVSHFIFTILTCLSIYAIGKRLSGHQAGLWGVLIFLSIPYTIILSYRSVVEMPLAFYETMAVFSLILWLLKRENKWVVISGINCGLAIGAKYTGFYSFVALIVVVLIGSIVNGESLRNTLKSTAVFIFTALLVFLPWFLYNYFYTGNPMYPYLCKYIGHIVPRTPEDSVLKLLDYSNFQKNLWEVFRGPWNITMGKAEEAFIGPILLIFLPFFLFQKPRSNIPKILFIYIFINWFIWAIAHGNYIRYFVPVIPVLCMLCGYYAAEVQLKKQVKKIFYLILSTVMFANVLFAMSIQKFTNNSLGVTLGFMSKSDYLNKSRMTYPNPYYEMAEWINKNLSRDALIYMMGELRTFGIERKVVMCDFSDYIPLIVWSGQAKNGDELYMKIKEKGITHILLNMPEAKRLVVFDLINFEPDELNVFNQFWVKYVEEVRSSVADFEIVSKGIFSLKVQDRQWWNKYTSDPNNYVYLYRVLSEEEAQKSHTVPVNFFLSPAVYNANRWKKLEPKVGTRFGKNILNNK